MTNPNKIGEIFEGDIEHKGRIIGKVYDGYESASDLNHKNMGESQDKEQPKKELSFYGIVNLKEYVKAPNGQNTLQLEGNLTIREDRDLVGFRVSGHVSDNWCVVITGKQTEWIVLGCQIRMVVNCPPALITSPEVYKVI
jgi:hypothetical protein